MPYAPGRLEAVAKKAGREVSRFAVETAGEPVALRLTPDRDALAGDGRDAVPVTIDAVDAKGRHVPTANLAVELALAGPGENIGVGNGEPAGHDPEKGNKVKIYNGLAQVILQSRGGGAGDLVLRASSAGLAPAETTIQVRSVPAVPSVPVVAQ